jgi:hypothetical protein
LAIFRKQTCASSRTTFRDRIRSEDRVAPVLPVSVVPAVQPPHSCMAPNMRGASVEATSSR